MLVRMHLSIYDFEHTDISEIRWMYNWDQQRRKEENLDGKS